MANFGPFGFSEDYLQRWRNDRFGSTGLSVDSDSFDWEEFSRNGTDVSAFNELNSSACHNSTPPDSPEEHPSDYTRTTVSDQLFTPNNIRSTSTPIAAAHRAAINQLRYRSPTENNPPARAPVAVVGSIDEQTLKLYADLLKFTGRKNWDILCPFCRNNGEEPSLFKSHALKDSDGRTTCPVLRRYICPKCNATGDEAHTISYCPLYDGSKRASHRRTSGSKLSPDSVAYSSEGFISEGINFSAGRMRKPAAGSYHMTYQPPPSSAVTTTMSSQVPTPTTTAVYVLPFPVNYLPSWESR